MHIKSVSWLERIELQVLCADAFFTEKRQRPRAAQTRCKQPNFQFCSGRCPAGRSFDQILNPSVRGPLIRRSYRRTPPTKGKLFMCILCPLLFVHFV